jgi:hypothetical protein
VASFGVSEHYFWFAGGRIRTLCCGGSENGIQRVLRIDEQAVERGEGASVHGISLLPCASRPWFT